MNKEYETAPGYIFHKRLGEGGFGNVDLCIVSQDPDRGNNGELVAVKSIHEDKLNDKEIGPIVRKMFLNEYHYLRKIKSANLPTVYERPKKGKNIYIIMENVRGYDLSQIINYNSNKLEFINPDQAAFIIHQAGLGLQAAHDAGITHRDIKPQNIMVERKANPVSIKVMDLGIAIERILEEEGEIIDDNPGSPNYMSPEQHRKDKYLELYRNADNGKEAEKYFQAYKDEKIGPKSDIFQLGEVWYALLTNEKPFLTKTYQIKAPKKEDIKHLLKHKESEGIKDALRHLVIKDLSIEERKEKGQYIHPRKINRKIPVIYSDMITKMLEAEKNKRYDSMAEITGELETKLNRRKLNRDKIGRDLKTYLQTISLTSPPIVYPQKINGPEEKCHL